MAGANMESITSMAQIWAEVCKLLATILAGEKELTDERARAMKECAELLQNGDPGCYKIFSNEDAKEMEALLLKNNIPWLPVASGGRETILVVPKKFEAEFLEIQEAFRYTDIGQYKDVNENDMLESLKNVYDTVPVLHYDSNEAASLAVEKLYASGIPCSKEKNPNSDTYDIIIHPQSMYKNGPGNDFTTFELLMAYEQSKNCEALGVGDEWQNMRLEQAMFDEGRMDDFAMRAARGENVVLTDLSPDKPSKFYIEAKNGEISVGRLNDDGKWEKTTFRNCDKAGIDDIKKMCSRYTEEIHNMGVTDIKTFEEHYKGKVPDMDYRTPENKRPVFSNDLLERCGREELKPLLDRLQREAGRATRDHYRNAKTRVDRTDMEQIDTALNFQRRYIVEKLRDPDYRPVADFINKNTQGLSHAQKKAWIMDIAKQLEGTGRSSIINATLDKVDIKTQTKRSNARAAAKEAERAAEREEESRE